MKNTKVFSLFGGPGCGKSTLATQLYSKMKLNGYSVELVREYVKGWAYEGRKINKFDQIYIFGKQCRGENVLYGKVDYIITDSPIILGAVYEKIYTEREIITPSLLKYIQFTKDEGVDRVNFLLKRNKPYDTNGRYETEEQAKKVDIKIKEFLDEHSFAYNYLDCKDEERTDQILKDL